MDWTTIILAVSSSLGGLGAFFLWLETRGERGTKRRQTRIDARVHTALIPVQADMAGIHAKLDHLTLQYESHLSTALHDALEPVRDQLTVLNTKIEPLWVALIKVGINQTDVLHQPDPRRAEYDALLEELQAELRGGPLMSADRFLRLRHFLELTKTWEPGQELDFPVHPAEPTSASILLAIMDLSRVHRRQRTSS